MFLHQKVPLRRMQELPNKVSFPSWLGWWEPPTSAFQLLRVLFTSDLLWPSALINLLKANSEQGWRGPVSPDWNLQQWISHYSLEKDQQGNWWFPFAPPHKPNYVKGKQTLLNSRRDLKQTKKLKGKQKQQQQPKTPKTLKPQDLIFSQIIHEFLGK